MKNTYFHQMRLSYAWPPCIFSAVSQNGIFSEPLGALIALPVNAHDTSLFFASDTDIHGTVSSSAAGFASGAFTFVVKYTNII